MAGDFNKSRRTLLGASALGFVAAWLGFVAAANAQAGNNNRTSASGTSKETFGPLKHVNAGVLSIAYAEAGPADGPPALLFHGWPYDIHSFVDVAPILPCSRRHPPAKCSGSSNTSPHGTAPHRPASSGACAGSAS
jgi:hypothetical protein